MATKPLVVPRIWANSTNWATGPFVGFPTKAVPGIGVSDDGHRPGSNFPTAAEHENSQQNRVTQWVTNWLALGSSAGAADAHVVEANAAGRSALVGLTLVDAVDEAVLDITGANTLAPTVNATCTTGAVVYQANIGNSTGAGYLAPVGTGAGKGFWAMLAGSLFPAVGVLVEADAATTGTGIEVDHAGTGTALRIDQTGTASSGSAVVVAATSGNTRGITASGAGLSPGLRGHSSATAGGNAVEGFLFNDDGSGFYMQTPVTSSVSGRAFEGAARGNATGGDFSSVNGPGLRASCSGTDAALYLPGRASDPANTFAGRKDFNTTTGTFVSSDPVGGNYRDDWSSRGGLVAGAASGGAATTAGNVAWINAVTLALTGQDAPRRGSRRVTLTFSCDCRAIGAGPTWLAVRIRDTTAGVTIATRDGIGVLDTSAFYLPDNTGNYQRGITWAVEYTVPSTGDRTFVVEIRGVTAVDVRVRQAALVPFGLY